MTPPEALPYKDELGYRALAETAFRMGFYYQQPYLKINDDVSKEYFITAGAGFRYGTVGLGYAYEDITDDALDSGHRVSLEFYF